MSELFTELPIGKFFENMVEKQPDHEFIIYPDRNLRFTYKEFDERVDNLAKGMLSIGIKPGDRVGIWAKNVPEWLTFMFACAKIGAAIVTVNTAYQSHELEYVLAQSEMKAIGMTDGFRDTSYFDIIHELVPEMLTSARGNLNSEKFHYLKYIIHVGQEKHRGMFNTNELLLLGMNYDDDEYQKIKDAVTQNDVINMQYTSGTEGFPKGVMLTSRNILNDGYYIGENMNYTEKDKLLLQVPLFHCFGTVLGVMAVITHGSTMVVLEEYDPLLAISSIQKEKCTSIYGVPTMFIGMMNHPMFEMFDMSSLRTGIMAGSTCPVETMKDAIENVGQFVATEDWQKVILQKARGFVAQTQATCFFIGGSSGSGKTHISTLICRTLMERGHSLLYRKWIEVMRELTDYRNEQRGELFKELTEIEVLYLDDVFKPSGAAPDPREVRATFEIVDRRYTQPNKITLISSELTLGKIRAVDIATARRIEELAGSGAFVVNVGEDRVFGRVDYRHSQGQ